MQYRECPRCGAHLDPGEICDCRRECAELTPSKNQKSQPEDHRTGPVREIKKPAGATA